MELSCLILILKHHVCTDVQTSIQPNWSEFKLRIARYLDM